MIVNENITNMKNTISINEYSLNPTVKKSSYNTNFQKHTTLFQENY